MTRGVHSPAIAIAAAVILRPLAAILAAALVWFVLLRWTRAMDQADSQRFVNLGRSLPGRIRPAWHSVVRWIAPGTAPI